MGVYAGQTPYGDIYRMPTSAIDTIAARIYQEQKMREQQKLQQDKALDDEFARNVAGVKSADIPEITKAYSDFKQAHINLQRKGQKVTPQDQMDLMMKKAAAFQAINASKEDKARLAQYTAEVKSDKKGVFDPNAHNMISSMLNTPTSQRKLDEDGNIKYKYAMPNLDKEIMYATKRDDGADFELTVGVDPNDPLKDKKEVYKRVNPPNVFYDRLFTQLGTRSDNRNFTRAVMDNITDEELEKLRIRYETKTKDPKFIALYGEVKPFPESAGNTELGQAVAIKTMQAVDAIPLEKVGEKSVLNADRNKLRGVSDKIDTEGRANKEWDRRNKITYGQSLAKIRLNNQNKKEGLPTEDTGYVSDEVAAENGEIVNVATWGSPEDKRTVVYVDKVDPERLDMIIGRDLSKKQLGVSPVDINGRKGYFVDPSSGDWEGAKGQKISREAAKDRYIKNVSPTKFKVQVGTKASENTKGKAPANKPIVKPKKDPLGLGF